jgi:type I restriction enzyme M protein
MLDSETKRRIDTARDVLVGKVPDPKSQVEQITIALIYKFMDDMDKEAVELGGKPSFFTGDYEKYSWSKIFDPKLGGHEMLSLYGDALATMDHNPHIPQLFREIFKNAYLPYRDPETLKLFLKTISEFRYDHSERLGDAFEYLLSVLGSQGDAGQFRTPRHIIDFIVAVIQPKKNETILDPACGTAGFLISAFKYIMQENTKKTKGDLLTPDERKKLIQNIVGYDISPDMERLSLVNMYLHGFTSPRIYQYDTLTEQDKWNEYYDVIMANPPFMSPKGGIRPHKRFAVQANRSEVLFLDYIAEHLNPMGRAGIIVPEGIIFQSANAYKEIRKVLVKEYLWAVVSLPAGVFNPYSGVKTSILYLDRALAKKSASVLFVKIQNDGFDLGAQRREVKGSDLPDGLNLLLTFRDMVLQDKEEQFVGVHSSLQSLTVLKEGIVQNGEYNLSAERYRGNDVQHRGEYEIKRLGELTKLFVDGDWIETKDQAETGIRLIQTGNVGFGEFLDKAEKARFISEETFRRLNCTEVFEGDVLISRLPDPVGRSCLVPRSQNRMITAVDCTIVRFDETKLLPKLFVYLTRTENYYKELNQYLTGASRQRVSRSNLAQIRLPIAPISVQKEIVVKLERYQNIIDRAKHTIAAYQSQIEVDPEWPRQKLGDLSDIVRGSSPRPQGDPKYYGGNIPRLMIADITRDGMYVEPKIDFLTEEGAKLSRPMKKGDVVIAVSGNVGLPAILKVDACVHDGFVGFRELAKDIMPEFLYYYLLQQKEQSGDQSIGAIFKNLTTNQVSDFEIPLPSLEVQKHVVSQIEHERRLVAGNNELIGLFETRITNIMNQLWEV